MSVGGTPRERIVEVVGYHGTSRANAAAILDRATAEPLRPGLGFEPRDWLGHWLGQGIYLWQDAPRRAQEWARATHGADAAVLGALLYLPLNDCIDLFDVAWVS